MATFLKLQLREVEPFTNREEDVIRLMAKGCQVRGGEQLLGVTAHTIRPTSDTHRKLRISSRAEATLRAARCGLINIS